jgi:WD40 repeat protein
VLGVLGVIKAGNILPLLTKTTPYFTLLDHTTPGTVTLATTYAIGAASRNVKFSPDGNYIAVANTGITLLSFSAGSVSLATTYNAGTGGGLSYTPDGNYLASGTSSPGLTLLNSSTPGSLSLATTYSSGSIDNAEFSSDGNYLAISTTGQTNLRLLNHTTPGSLSFATFI